MTHAQETEFLPSASGMPRVFHCHGSVAFARDAGESRPSDEAVQGSEIAAALEAMNLEGLDDDSKTIAQRLQDMEKKALGDWIFDTGIPGHLMNREERLWIRDRTTRQKVSSAKPDVYYISGEHGLVLNHKSGYLPIPPASINIQIRTEALALWHEYPRLTRIRACTAHYRFKEKFDACDYTLEHLHQAEAELFWHLKQANNPHAPRVPGAHCRYCPALSMCPEAASHAMLPQVHTGPKLLKKQDAIEVAHKLSLDQLAFIVLRFPMLHNFEDAVKDRLKACSDEELASVGLRRQATGNVTICDDVQKLWACVHESRLLTEAEFRACLKPVIGQIEAKMVEKLVAATSCKDDVALKAAKTIIAPAVEQKPKQPTIKAIKGE